MTASEACDTHPRYVLGIDVGTNSIGYAALEIDTEGAPVRVLMAKSHIHDGGVVAPKTGESHKEARGVARRARRHTTTRKQLRDTITTTLTDLGYPTDVGDPTTIDPWTVRADLATRDQSTTPDVMRRNVSIAVQHIARHRGARNPWQRLERFLAAPYEPSEPMRTLTDNARTADPGLPDTPTQAQAVTALRGGDSTVRVRTANNDREGLLVGRFMQADLLHEWRTIAATQHLPADHTRRIEHVLFAMGDPSAAAAERAGKDPLDRTQTRALRAHPAIQKYRVATAVANLRLTDTITGEIRRLTPDERATITDTLMGWDRKEPPTWDNVHTLLGDHTELSGYDAGDGEHTAPTRPPYNTTGHRITGPGASTPTLLRDWWTNPATSSDHQAALVAYLANSPIPDGPTKDDLMDVMVHLDEGDHTNLDKVKLETGRAHYSARTAERITDLILSTTMDLHDARKHLFALPDDWAPPAPEVRAPTGNPTVDRVLVHTHKVLDALDALYGPPERITIEHVRDGFATEKTRKTLTYDMRVRATRKEELRDQVRADLGLDAGATIHTDTLTKHQLLTQQHGQCLYCGTPLTLTTAEVDHIVPRRGVGSNNRITNLAATCRPCNASKTNTPFAVWVQHTTRPVTLTDVLDRVDHLNLDHTWTGGTTATARKRHLARIKARLQRVTPETTDERPIESVAFMGRELRARLTHRYRNHGTTIAVYPGTITAEARHATGINTQLRMHGEQLGIPTGKTRLDRRHHAIDAATIALMEPAAAQVLAERVLLRADARTTGHDNGWKTWDGAPTGTHPTPDQIGRRTRYHQWVDRTRTLPDLLNTALTSDRIPVTRDLRLTPNGAAHDDTIRPLNRTHTIGDTFTPDDLRRVAHRPDWFALTTHPDHNPNTGLPANPGRTLTINGHTHGPNHTIPLYPSGGALCVPVRDGYAQGAPIHHARIYTWTTNGKPKYGWVRVTTADLYRHDRYTGNPLTRPLTPDMLSLRYADPAVRDAILNGNATELGHLYIGDELTLTPPAKPSGAAQAVLNAFPGTTRWVLTGFPTTIQVAIVPAHIAKEGLPPKPATDDNSDGAPQLRQLHDALERVRININPLCTQWGLTVVRRDTLGNERPPGTRNSGWTIPPTN